MFYSQRDFLYHCRAPMHEVENRTLSNRFSTFFLDSAMYERRKECFLRRLIKDRSETTPIEVNNFDKSKRRSLCRVLRVDVIRKLGPDWLAECEVQSSPGTSWPSGMV